MGLLNILGFTAGRSARRIASKVAPELVVPATAAAPVQEIPEKKTPESLAEYGGFKNEEEMYAALADYMVHTADSSDDPEDPYQVGMMYYYGVGPYGRGKFTQDISEGMRWLRKSADRGYAEAQHTLGVAYSEQNDTRNALRFFTLAAEQGHAAALAHLGMLYALEDEVIHDQKRSHQFMYDAAVRNDAFAQYAVAENYRQGAGVAADQAEYLKWCRKAAENNERHAQYKMGVECEKSGNLPEAIQWYQKAADNGWEEACQKLNELQ